MDSPEKNNGPQLTTTIGGTEYSYTYDPKTFTMSTLTPTGSLNVNTISAVGSSPYTIGPTWTTNGTGPTWSTLSDTVHVQQSGKISLNGPGADVEINGESLLGMFKRIEERLAILKPNEKLEAEWDQLRELGDQYRKLEQELLEKSRMWETLKK